MNIRTNWELFQLITSLLQKKTKKVNFYSYPKPPFSSDSKVNALPELLCDLEGIPSSYFSHFYQQLFLENKFNIHSILFLKNGKRISQAAMPPYKTTIWHQTHSMCKTLTGLAIGLLIDDKKLSLSTTIKELFAMPYKLSPHSFVGNITIKHLLTMSSGIQINETISLLKTDWLSELLHSKLLFEPGSQFSYNSMNTYLLSAIIRQITNQNLSMFLKERIFEPMQIEQYAWETCPAGIEKGGFGLYMNIQDMAKIGQLYLQNGIWNNMQLISKYWVSESTKKQIDTKKETYSYGYGYHMWIGMIPNTYQFNGMLGQNVIVLKDQNMVIAATAGSAAFTPAKDYSPLLYHYFGTFSNSQNIAYSLHSFHKKKKHTHKVRTFFHQASKLPYFCSLISNCKIIIKQQTFSSLLPVFLQCLYNTFSDGISMFSFYCKKNSFYLMCKEENSFYSIPIGFSDYKKSSITIQNNCFLIAAKGVFKKLNPSTLLLTIFIHYLETANTRQFEFTFSIPSISDMENSVVIVALKESPELGKLLDGFSYLTNFPIHSALLSKVLSYLSPSMSGSCIRCNTLTDSPFQ